MASNTQSLGGVTPYNTGYVNALTLLGRPELDAMIQLSRDGTPKVFPPSFNADYQTVPADYVQAFSETGSRNLVPLVQYDSKSRMIQMKPLGETFLRLFSLRFNKQLQPSQYMNLINFTDLNAQKMGMKEIGRQIKDSIARMYNTREQLLAAMLFQGNVWVDKNGEILPNSTNAVYTSNVGIPSGNTGQLNVFGTGNLLSVGWENTGSAQPDLDVLSVRQAAVRLTGYPTRHAFYGINVPGYLSQNARLSTYFYRDVFRQDGVGTTYIDTAEFATGMLGLNWIPAWASFYIVGLEYPGSIPSPYSATPSLYGPSVYPNNTSGIPQIASMVGSSMVTFTPDPGEYNFIRHYEGKYPLPDSTNIIIKPMPIPENDGATDLPLNTPAGMWMYMKAIDDPTTLGLFFGDTYSSWITVPQAIFQGTTNF